MINSKGEQSTAVEGEVVKRHPGGRPPKLTPEERAEVYQAFQQYIDRTPDPMIVGFCAWDPVATKYRISKDNLYDWQEFSELRKIAIEKQEAYLVTGATTGRLNTVMAIFRLKQPQHGYKDKVETDITNSDGKLQPVLVKYITGESNADTSAS